MRLAIQQHSKRFGGFRVAFVLSAVAWNKVVLAVFAEIALLAPNSSVLEDDVSLGTAFATCCYWTAEKLRILAYLSAVNHSLSMKRRKPSLR